MVLPGLGPVLPSRRLLDRVPALSALAVNVREAPDPEGRGGGQTRPYIAPATLTPAAEEFQP
ncbi:MAG: hypothetical protein M3N32_03035 [Actinomycetota bacterium]|nr:hypothetical protein [Actinomycetota bacterium]